jgi:Protein phosphatase 2C
MLGASMQELSAHRLMLVSCMPSGLWDVLSSQRAVDFARARLRAHNDPTACSRDLVRARPLPSVLCVSRDILIRT